MQCRVDLCIIGIRTTTVRAPGPPVHGVRPAGTCSDTVYDAHAPTLACRSAKSWTRRDTAEQHGEPD